MPVEPVKDTKYPEGNVTAGPYIDDELGGELTLDELKAAFRYSIAISNNIKTI